MKNLSAAAARPAPRRMLLAVQRLAPGVLVSLAIAMASAFIADHYGGPTLLYALLFGMACHFLSEDGRCLASNSLPGTFCAWGWPCSARASPWSKSVRWACPR